jgi:tetratricopeptide (TPR) repeat protein
MLLSDRLSDKASMVVAHTIPMMIGGVLCGAWFNRGASRYSKGDYAGAVSDYTRAIELDPRNAVAYSNRGNARRANGDLAGAMNDYDQALILDPRCALALLNRGIGYLQQGREAEAQRDFDQCLKIDPTLRTELEAVVGEARRRLRGIR